MKTSLRFSVTVLLCLIVCIFVAPAVFAETVIDSGTCGAQGDNLTWKMYDNGELVIEGSGEMADYWFSNQPSRPWEAYTDSITEIVVNDGVTTLGAYSFYSLTSLRRVVLPEGITCIAYAFDGCINLVDINLPASLTTLDNLCLWNTGIEELTIPATVTNVSGHFYGGMLGAKIKRIETVPNHPSFSAVDGVLFTKDLSTLVMNPCCDQSTYTVPDETTAIREHAFCLCPLSSLIIPKNVKSIGNYAFLLCSSLTDVYYGGTQEQWNQIIIESGNDDLLNATIHYSENPIPFSGDSGTWGNLEWTLDENYVLTIFGNGSMQDFDWESNDAWLLYKSRIAEVVINDGITSIGSCAFYECSSLTSIIIPNGVTSIGNGAFYGCSSLKTIMIPEGVTSIERVAFLGCSSLTSIIIPNGVTSIGIYAFEKCSHLKSVTIPESVTSIGNGAFFDCSSLTSITIPESVTSIGYNAFLRCSSLTSIVIPEGVTSIENGTFLSCSSLTNITIPAWVTRICIDAFSGCSSLADVYYTGTETQWNMIDIESDNECLLNATIHYNYIRPDFVLPTSLTEIHEEAFAGGAFRFVKLPEGTVSIGSRAFADCPNLSYIFIPASTTSIDQTAFENVSNLTIYGKEGSYAEFFAWKYGYTFISE